MTVDEDDWVLAATRDDTLVAQLLLKLNEASQLPPPSLNWSVKQRRSKKVLLQLQRRRKKSDEATRASPTTPLSWSGATSMSCGGGGGGVDGFEESSLPAMKIESPRSKALVTSGTPATKRSRKKKTLADLKEEEGLLLRERRNLKNQLATLQLTVEKERAKNESLKRIKFDSPLRRLQERFTVNSSQCQQIEAAVDPMSSAVPISASCNKLEQYPNAIFETQEVWCRQPPSFVVPDLNLPVDADSSPDVLYGLS